ncbi:hypothetical protein SSS_01624 [Sarcoptes scabiei]|uniref:Uncharacterized protein n=1 Tax=Sarcoptes scabiei TaxID=52283 RepID=A0A834RHY6_SARSC|nr:hypothetical protein SSS_01624 [Sarcoptes scabiei]UXI17694.1 iron-sulfur cluster assembly 1 [Sarcoptes scabiei]
MLNKPQCRSEKRQTKVNEFMEKLVVFGQSDRKFPENFAQVKPFCSETREMIAYIEDYLKECFQPDIQSLANILIYTLKRHIRVFCNKRSNNLRLKKLLPLMPCINEQVQRYPQCIRTMMNKTSELIASQIEDRSKIKYVCCYYAEFIDCGDNFLESLPCAKKDRELLLDFLRGLSSDIVRFGCNEYHENSDRCTQLPTISLSSDKPRPKYYTSVLALILDMINSMDTLWIE